MVRNGFKQVDRDSNNFRLGNCNDLHTCGTSDVSHFIKTQQSNYQASHILSESHEASLTTVMFNDDVYTIRRRFKSLIEQVIHDRNISIEQFCMLSVNRRVGGKITKTYNK